MMALFFLAVCAVGILRPIKNALALDGLGDTDFYKVYVVSAVVILFVPLYNRAADRLPWRWLIPSISLFFALQLVALRAFYVEGSTAFGLVFYGWYDLFASALIAQFFMAAQLFVDARLARRAYPVVIAGGALGATLGGAITALLALRLGTPNLMLVAAGLILVFTIVLPLVWREPVSAPQRRHVGHPHLPGARELRALLSNPHVRLIAGMVLLMVVVKQLIDYQFNTLSKAVYQERDAISAFQGRFNAATQWLPLVAVVLLQPLLRRWGVGLAVLLLPVAMLLSSAALVVFWGLAGAVVAKAAETTLRYSAERAGREILYVPIPDHVKLRAKAYIDIAIEKGLGKLLAAGLIFLLLALPGSRTIAVVTVALGLVWVLLALRVRAAYVRSLAHSIDSGFASLHGVFASLADSTSAAVIRRALHGTDAQASFALDLVAQSRARELGPLRDELHALLEHASPRIRRRALDVLGATGQLDRQRVRSRLLDDDAHVREAAVRALYAVGGTPGLFEELLASEHERVRLAALECLVHGSVSDDALAAARRAYARHWPKDGREDGAGRLELALAVGALRMGGEGAALIEPLLQDEDPRVVATALRSVARTGRLTALPRLIAALRAPATREAARDALAEQGATVVPPLLRVLLDSQADRAVRRSIPDVLARIPAHETVAALVRGALAAETDQLLDARAVSALSRLRARHPALSFDPDLVLALIRREATFAGNLLEAEAALARAAVDDAVAMLLRAGLREAGEERREHIFRCLGLIYDPAAMHRCWYALARGDARSRASAHEWLEHTVDRELYTVIAPVLGEMNGKTRRRNPLRALGALAAGDDAWLACCARRVAAALYETHPPAERSTSMDLVDKVFLLQHMDLLRGAQSAHLALVASIADEVDAATGTVLLQRGAPADAAWVVISGSVDVSSGGGSRAAGANDAFGAGALLDASPSLVHAVATSQSRLLRIGGDDFRDLLSDHPELAITMLQAIGARLRALAIDAGTPGSSQPSMYALL